MVLEDLFTRKGLFFLTYLKGKQMTNLIEKVNGGVSDLTLIVRKYNR